MPEQPASSSTSSSAPADSFFVLRECRELFQRRLAEIVRDSGIATSSVLEAFVNEVGTAHDELVAAVHQDGFEQTNGLTASRISLVGNDDLELEIRIGEVVNRLRNNERIGHWRAQLRYMTLLNRPKMNAETNPLGVDPINRGLWSICREGGGTLEQNLERLERLEQRLQAQLPKVYAELNALLERHGIAPAQVKIVQRAAAGMPAVSGAGGSADQGGLSDANALSALRQVLSKRFGTEDNAPAVGIAGHSAGGPGNVTLDVSSVVALNHLIDRLRALELHRMASAEKAPTAPSDQPAPFLAFKSTDLDLPLGQPAAIALDTLSLIYEAIFDAPELPDAVKAAIARLQIPLLRLAILDPTFFTNTTHPARRLVNRMAQAAVGLNQDTGHDNAVCIGLGKLADAARATLENGDGELTPHLDELDALIAERDHSNQAKSQPYRQLVLEHENREAARSNADAWLRQVLVNTTEPAIRLFLAEHWRRVMEAACQDGGTTGSRWQQNAACIVDLLWSVRPKPTAEERKRLVALIPSLLKRINAELDRLAIAAEERAPFINACLDLQTAAMRNRADAPGSTAQAAVPAVPAAAVLRAAPGIEPEPQVEILERDGKLVQYLSLPTTTPSRWRTAAYAWQDGDWIRFFLPDGDHLCGRVCWQSPTTETVLLYNPGWGYAVALAPSSLEQQLRSGRARIVSSSLLFDDAAERALAQIAKI